MAGQVDMKSRLAQMNAEWQAKKDQPPGVPGGKYNFQCQKLELTESASGKLMLKREHYVLDGEHAGDVARDNICIETDFGYRQLAIYIEQMGYTVPTDAEELEDIFTAIQNDAPCYSGTVKYRAGSDFANVNIESLIDNDATGTPPPAKAKARAPAKKDPPAASIPDTKPDIDEAPSDGLAVGMNVSFDNEGTITNGKITELKEGSVEVEDEEQNLYEVPTEEIKVAPEQDEAAPEGDAGMDDPSALLALCTAHGIEGVDENTTYAEAMEAINKFEFAKSELTAEEIELLEGINGNFKVEPKATPAKKPAPAPVKKPAPAPVKAAPAKVAAPKPVTKAVAKPVPAKASVKAPPKPVPKKK